MASSSSQCSRCNKTVFPADRKQTYQAKIYHSGCFKCSISDCGTTLTEKSVHGFDQMPYCAKHCYGPESTAFSGENEAEIIMRDERAPSNLPSSEKVPKEKIKSILRESIVPMFDDVSQKLLQDLNIVVCGSPRVGKSTLINSLCGRELTEAKEGMNSVTNEIRCHTVEGEFSTDSEITHYRYSFWDTPGFESWEKHDVRSKMKEILNKPETKPLCMIFCAAPTTFVNVEQLEWLLDECIQKKHIFCALVCTNKHAGPLKNRRAVLAEYDRLLSKYVDESPREADGITFYGTVGLTAAVNCQPYETDTGILPISGLNELNLAIMESLVDDQVTSWCMVLLENRGFWDSIQHKAAKSMKKQARSILEKLTGKGKKNKKIKKVTSVDYGL